MGLSNNKKCLYISFLLKYSKNIVLMIQLMFKRTVISLSESFITQYFTLSPLSLNSSKLIKFFFNEIIVKFNINLLIDIL